jgi:hypothetical protein
VNRRASIRSEDLVFFTVVGMGSTSQHSFPLSNAFFSLSGRRGCALCNEVLGEVWMRFIAEGG